MNKYDVLEVIDELESEVQELRESGEGDLRTVLHLISSAYRKIKEMD